MHQPPAKCTDPRAKMQPLIKIKGPCDPLDSTTRKIKVCYISRKSLEFWAICNMGCAGRRHTFLGRGGNLSGMTGDSFSSRVARYSYSAQSPTHPAFPPLGPGGHQRSLFLLRAAVPPRRRAAAGAMPDDWVNRDAHRRDLSAQEEDQARAVAAARWWERARPPRVKCGTTWLLAPTASAKSR